MSPLKLGTSVWNNMKFKLLALAFLFITLSVFVWREYGKGKLLRINDSVFNVEIARSPAELTLGLGKRKELGADGMLFVLPVRIVPQFWMKDMEFGLDFVWIDGERVVALTEKVPAPSNGSAPQAVSPGLQVTHVLELPLGDIAKHGIKVGDRVEGID